MSPIRVSAVEYLNARPLVHGLEARPDLFDLQFDIPSRCAAQLHDRSVDLGLIPSIEYLQRSDYRIVPDVAVTSDGDVASVALFTTRPATSLRSVAVDSSSRTASALLRVLCTEWWDIDPKMVKLRPDLPVMLKRCDAALVIGDAALFLDYESQGLEKVDLGDEWTAMTSLPFVWAMWVGRQGAVHADHVKALQAARASGVQAIDEIVARHCPDDEESLEAGRQYLRNNVSFDLDERALAGLRKFHEYAYDLRVVPTRNDLRFFESPPA
ncbi:MAG: menaquinone biosynthesis protein [Vicinamibacterales bacterium]|jgi:chorismate dehydratase|nr:menaquinone biosynthesis protein [Vicinamibacterales bacterium]